MIVLLLGLTTASALSMPEVEASLEAYAKESCQASDVQVTWLGLSNMLPGGQNAELHWTGNPCQSRPLLKLKAVEGHQLLGSWRMRPALDIWKPFPVAASDAAVGELVSTRVEPVLLKEIRGQQVGEGTWVARVALSEGDPLTDRVLRRRPDSARGSVVRIEVRQGALTIAADGRLMEDAFVGEDVRVLNLATRSTQRGRLVAQSRVEIR